MKNLKVLMAVLVTALVLGCTTTSLRSDSNKLVQTSRHSRKAVNLRDEYRDTEEALYFFGETYDRIPSLEEAMALSEAMVKKEICAYVGQQIIAQEVSKGRITLNGDGSTEQYLVSELLLSSESSQKISTLKPVEKYWEKYTTLSGENLYRAIAVYEVSKHFLAKLIDKNQQMAVKKLQEEQAALDRGWNWIKESSPKNSHYFSVSGSGMNVQLLADQLLEQIALTLLKKFNNSLPANEMESFVHSVAKVKKLTTKHGLVFMIASVSHEDFCRKMIAMADKAIVQLRSRNTLLEDWKRQNIRHSSESVSYLEKEVQENKTRIDEAKRLYLLYKADDDPAFFKILKYNGIKSQEDVEILYNNISSNYRWITDIAAADYDRLEKQYKEIMEQNQEIFAQYEDLQRKNADMRKAIGLLSKLLSKGNSNVLDTIQKRLKLLNCQLEDKLNTIEGLIEELPGQNPAKPEDISTKVHRTINAFGEMIIEYDTEENKNTACLILIYDPNDKLLFHDLMQPTAKGFSITLVDKNLVANARTARLKFAVF